MISLERHSKTTSTTSASGEGISVCILERNRHLNGLSRRHTSTFGGVGQTTTTILNRSGYNSHSCARVFSVRLRTSQSGRRLMERLGTFTYRSRGVKSVFFRYHSCLILLTSRTFRPDALLADRGLSRSCDKDGSQLTDSSSCNCFDAIMTPHSGGTSFDCYSMGTLRARCHTTELACKSSVVSRMTYSRMATQHLNGRAGVRMPSS
jgi:hypothetical protein